MFSSIIQFDYLVKIKRLFYFKTTITFKTPRMPINVKLSIAIGVKELSLRQLLLCNILRYIRRSSKLQSTQTLKMLIHECTKWLPVWQIKKYSQPTCKERVPVRRTLMSCIILVCQWNILR